MNQYLVHVSFSNLGFMNFLPIIFVTLSELNCAPGQPADTGSGSPKKAGVLNKSTVEHNAHIVYRCFEFLFYLGWIQVAKIMLNPFGEDEDDIEVNHIINRNLAASFLIVNGDRKDFPSKPVDTFAGSKLPVPALSYEHDDTGPLPFEKIRDGDMLIGW